MQILQNIALHSITFFGIDIKLIFYREEEREISGVVSVEHDK